MCMDTRAAHTCTLVLYIAYIASAHLALVVPAQGPVPLCQFKALIPAHRTGMRSSVMPTHMPAIYDAGWDDLWRVARDLALLIPGWVSGTGRGQTGLVLWLLPHLRQECGHLSGR